MLLKSMARLRVKLMSTKSNYQALRKLRGVVKNKEDLRHEIIFYDTLIGSYGIREKRPQNFIVEKQRSGEVHEADFISMQRQNTLEILGYISPEEVLDILKKRAKEIDDNKISKIGIYPHFKDYQTRERVIHLGENIEKKIYEKKRVIGRNSEQQRRADVFSIEADCLIRAFLFQNL
jgi:hypothetical protein